MKNATRRNIATTQNTREGISMSRELEMLLAASNRERFTEEQREKQRRSFAYGNTHFENSRITRETVDRAAEALEQNGPANGHSKR